MTKTFQLRETDPIISLLLILYITAFITTTKLGFDFSSWSDKIRKHIEFQGMRRQRVTAILVGYFCLDDLVEV